MYVHGGRAPSRVVVARVVGDVRRERQTPCPQDDAETARVYQEFLRTFQPDDSVGEKTFVRGTEPGGSEDPRVFGVLRKAFPRKASLSW